MVDIRSIGSTAWRRALPAALAAAAAFLAGGCMGRPGTPPTPPPLQRPSPPGASTKVSVRVDSSQDLVLMEAGPFRIPEAGSGLGHHGGHMHEGADTPLLLFDWPVEGWYRGYRVRLVDENGDTIPQATMHHVIGVNFDRRQVVYPVPERFMGAGTETGDILLPKQIGVPMRKGTRLGVYAVWKNHTGHEIDNAYIRVALAYTPQSSGMKPREVVPIYMDTNERIGDTNAFDLPPGRSTESHVFTVPVDGALLGLSGHLHDYGKEVRLEDAETGKVLVRLHGITDGEGHVEGVEQRIFRRFFGLFDASIPLRAGHRYRVVGVYDNTSGDTLRLSGMAHLSGVFAPTSMSGWSALDTSSEAYRKDVSGLPNPLPADRAPPGMQDRNGKRSGG